MDESYGFRWYITPENAATESRKMHDPLATARGTDMSPGLVPQILSSFRFTTCS